MRAIQAILLMLALLASGWLGMVPRNAPLRIGSADPANPCRCCRCGSATCCAAPDRAPPASAPVTAAPVRLLAGDELLTPPVPRSTVFSACSALLPGSVTATLLTAVDTPAAAPLFLRGCALQI